VYRFDQFEEWMFPLAKKDVAGKRVLELGCGNGSQMVHMATWEPEYLEGVDLGDSVESAKSNMSAQAHKNWKITKADLTTVQTDGFDLVYCIGVLHHLISPKKGLDAVIRNVKRGGRFHCWVYAREGNMLVMLFVEPLRRMFSRFPWWFTKYVVATPLAVPFFAYAKLLALFKNVRLLKSFPLYSYCQWIARREFPFFRHVAFDQLVTPQTTYIDRTTIENWLEAYPNLEKDSLYIIMRNGNSWKFGGRKLPHEA